MKMAVPMVSVGSAVPALLVALLVTCRIAVVAEGAACDTAICGIATCKEVPGTIPPIPAYECDCEAGWARVAPIVAFAPCFIPTCKSDLDCYTPNFKLPPFGSNITQDPCLVVDCGREGTCVEGDKDKPFFHCQCNPGTTNLFNNPSFPCTKNCKVGKDGCPIPNPPPPPPSPPPPPPSMAPPGNGTDPTSPSSSVGNPTVPTSPGSVCLRNLLLLASLATLYIV